jgi:hypothetical protein
MRLFSRNAKDASAPQGRHDPQSEKYRELALDFARRASAVLAPNARELESKHRTEYARAYAEIANVYAHLSSHPALDRSEGGRA